MLSEEALILLATFVAFGLLILGVWEYVFPSRRRQRERLPTESPTGLTAGEADHARAVGLFASLEQTRPAPERPRAASSRELIEERFAGIRRRIAAGDVDGAEADIEALHALLRDRVERELPADEVAALYRDVDRLASQIDRRRT